MVPCAPISLEPLKAFFKADVRVEVVLLNPACTTRALGFQLYADSLAMLRQRLDVVHGHVMEIWQREVHVYVCGGIGGGHDASGKLIVVDVQKRVHEGLHLCEVAVPGSVE